MLILLQVNSHEGKGCAKPIDRCGIYLNIFTAVTHDRQSFVRYHMEGFQIYPPAQTQLAEVQLKLF